MLPFEAIFGAIHDLSYEEKLKLRLLLEEEIKVSMPPRDPKQAKSLIGLLADEPELADMIVESAMKARETRLMRQPHE